MKIIAISGSSGFIGKNLIKSLKNESNKIIEIDISKGIDLLEQKCIKKIPKFDVYVHLAGLSFVPDSYKYPEKFYRTNYISTLNSLELCRKYKAKMIFISSYIYGKSKYLPIDEEHPISAFNPYSQTKIICEKLCAGYFRDFNVSSIILRPFNIYGIGQNDNFLIPSILKQIKNKEKIINLRESEPKRDFVYINDLINAIKKVIKDDSIKFDYFNICSNTSYSVKQVCTLINARIKDVEFKYNNNEKRINEISDTLGNYNKIKKTLSWEPLYSLEDGINEIIDKSNII